MHVRESRMWRADLRRLHRVLLSCAVGFLRLQSCALESLTAASPLPLLALYTLLEALPPLTAHRLVGIECSQQLIAAASDAALKPLQRGPRRVAASPGHLLLQGRPPPGMLADKQPDNKPLQVPSGCCPAATSPAGFPPFFSRTAATTLPSPRHAARLRAEDAAIQRSQLT